MSRAGWLKDPWNKVSEMVHELAPAELVKLLTAVWETLTDPEKCHPQVPVAVGVSVAGVVARACCL
jgi:hypothetical protein